MPSFQIALSPTKRASGRFLLAVRRRLQKAFLEENKRRGLTQAMIARELGVHRSVINRELRGEKDLTVGRLAELAHAMGRKPSFALLEKARTSGTNIYSSEIGHPATNTTELPQPVGCVDDDRKISTPTSEMFPESSMAAL
jgi:transcriptional regulator with XRE-family HTH domain